MGGWTVICPKCKLVWRVYPLGIPMNDEKMWEDFKIFYQEYKTLQEYRKAWEEDIEKQETCPNCGTKAVSIWDSKELSEEEKRDIVVGQQRQTIIDMDEIDKAKRR